MAEVDEPPDPDAREEAPDTDASVAAPPDSDAQVATPDSGEPPPPSPASGGGSVEIRAVGTHQVKAPRPSVADAGAAPSGRALVWAKRLATAGFAGLGVGCIAVAGILRHYEQNLPSTAELKHYDPPQVTRVLARDGSVLAELFTERRTVVALDTIPKSLKLAVLAAEDAEFYRHEGLNYLGMLRALAVNLRHGETRQGGSTITQQVVKNVLLGSERTFERKAREVLLARRIEQELSKDEILELYLNHIYFGHGRYGVEEAARYYFGKNVDKLTLSEAAMIAGLPKGPGVYSPRIDPARAKGRRNAVLEQMALKGFAPRELIEDAKAEPLVLAPAVEHLAELAPEVVAEVERTLEKLAGPAAKRGGYTVTTTIDPELQAAARAAVRKNLDAYAQRHGLVAPLRAPKPAGRSAAARAVKSKRDEPFAGTPSSTGHHVYNAVVRGADDAQGLVKIEVGTAHAVARIAPRYNPKGLPPSGFAENGAVVRVSPALERGLGDDGLPREYRLELGPESALVLIDVPAREIRALVGSYEGVRGGLDRATQAHRQPGSTFKPFVYSYAIHSRRMTAATVVPVEIPRPAWLPPPKPDEKKLPLFLRDALARSVNEAALWALGDLGAEPVVSWAAGLGVRADMKPTPSLALGAYGTTPRDLAAAYLTFASGLTGEPKLIARIVAPDGSELALPDRPLPRRALDEAETYLITNLLTSVVERGTARAARGVGFPLAGKTGTSNEAKDAWFAGYSPHYECVAWTGYDDAVPLGATEQGATAALPAVVEVLKAAHRGARTAPWPEPPGIVHARIDPATGKLAYLDQPGAIDELFLAGTVPTETAERPNDGAGGGAADSGAGGAAGNDRPKSNVTPPASATPSGTPPAMAPKEFVEIPPPF